MTYYCTLKTAQIGELFLTASETKLTGIFFADRGHLPQIKSDWKLNPKHRVLQVACEQLRDFLAGRRSTFSVPLQADGTEFQREVWRQIAKIPFGQTISYSELAKRSGAPRAIRAAGTATGKNPHAIVVPCHRVLAKDGTIGGYAGGLDRKKRLLGIEMGAGNARR